MSFTQLSAFPARPFHPIISVGRDKSVLSRRQSTLESLGILVQSMTPEQAAAFVRQPEPRLWIFCGTVETATLIYLAAAIRRYSPRSRLLFIEGPDPAGPESALFHQVVSAGAAHESLVSVVEDFSQAA